MIGCMDESRIETRGLMPLAADLATIDALVNPDDLPILVAYLHSIGARVFFRFGSPTDRRRQPFCTYMTATVEGAVLSDVLLHNLERHA